LKRLQFCIELILEEDTKNAIEIPDEERVVEYYEYRQQLDQLTADFREVITHPSYSLPFLLPGRLIRIKYQSLDFGWGVVINFQKRLPPKVRDSAAPSALPNIGLVHS